MATIVCERLSGIQPEGHVPHATARLWKEITAYHVPTMRNEHVNGQLIRVNIFAEAIRLADHQLNAALANIGDYEMVARLRSKGDFRSLDTLGAIDYTYDPTPDRATIQRYKAIEPVLQTLRTIQKRLMQGEHVVSKEARLKVVSGTILTRTQVEKIATQDHLSNEKIDAIGDAWESQQLAEQIADYNISFPPPVLQGLIEQGAVTKDEVTVALQQGVQISVRTLQNHAIDQLRQIGIPLEHENLPETLHHDPNPELQIRAFLGHHDITTFQDQEEVFILASIYAHRVNNQEVLRVDPHGKFAEYFYLQEFRMQQLTLLAAYHVGYPTHDLQEATAALVASLQNAQLQIHDIEQQLLRARSRVTPHRLTTLVRHQFGVSPDEFAATQERTGRVIEGLEQVFDDLNAQRIFGVVYIGVTMTPLPDVAYLWQELRVIYGRGERPKEVDTIRLQRLGDLFTKQPTLSALFENVDRVGEMDIAQRINIVLQWLFPGEEQGTIRAHIAEAILENERLDTLRTAARSHAMHDISTPVRRALDFGYGVASQRAQRRYAQSIETMETLILTTLAKQRKLIDRERV